MTQTAEAKLTPRDFKTDQEVRWCPGCGDYAILNAFQKAMANLGKTRENTVIVSGIGCSSRFPYYMETYGFHSIHGRATAVATGVKTANPNLDVWVITGDGDALSIGGNHLIHLLRRHPNIKVLMFNNRIYGLTKGQYSPTSLQGAVTKSTPMGAPDSPFNPICVALGANASFVARSVDVMGDHLTKVIERAAAHTGSAFVEIFQNCNIFNDGAWDHLVQRDIRSDHLVDLRHGEKLIFGQNKDKAVMLDGFTPKVVKLGEVPDEKLLTWDEKASPALPFIIATTDEFTMPVPIGIFRDVSTTPFESVIHQQIADAKAKKGEGSLEKLLYSGEIWEVK
jgi:2-oxoglutarate/2-oxoacid ferredoxin oxidoreductase subunit beta